MVALWFVKAPLKQMAQKMSKTDSLLWSKLKTCMHIGLFLWLQYSNQFHLLLKKAEASYDNTSYES